MQRRRLSRFGFAFLVVTAFAMLGIGVACGGGQAAAPAPQPQPAAQPAAPAPAAPAAEPAPPVPTRPAPAPEPKAAPAAPPAPPEAKYGGIMRVAVRQDASAAWDIMRITGWVDVHQMGAPIWGSGNLVTPCRDNVVQTCPALAESWEPNSDFTQWTFKIRDGVLWHDGTQFSAEDAKFWLELAVFGAKVGDKTRRPAWFKADFGPIQKVEVLEGQRLRVVLAKPERLFPDLIGRTFLHLAHPRHLMAPRLQTGEIDVAPQDIGWIGTGPFKMSLHEKGTRVQVRRFDRYWEKDAKGRQLPYLDGIDFAIIAPAAMDAAIRVGRLDAGAPAAGHVLSKERKTAYVRDLGDKVWFAEAASTSGSANQGFNVLKSGPQQDVRVRRAISLWIDRPASIEVISVGFGQVASILNPGNPFSSPDFMTWPGFNPATKERDRAEAKRLLAEAGYGKGTKMTHFCWAPTWLDRCQFYKAQFAGLGIDLELTLGDAAQRTRALSSLDFDFFDGNAVRTPFPEGMWRVMAPFSQNPASNFKHEDPKVTEFFDRLRGATSFEQRVQIYRELERYVVLEKVYLVPLNAGNQVVPYRSYVKGFPVPGEDLQNNLDHATVWLDK